MPALAGGFEGGMGGLFSSHLGNREVGDIRPLFAELQFVDIELLMELAHAVRSHFDPDENRRSDRDEGLDGSKRNFEGLFSVTDTLENLQGRTFGSAQETGRKDGEVGCQLGQVGMEFTPQVLDKLSRGVF